MSDIIDEIDRLHANSTSANFGQYMAAAWPAIRDRLREAERKAKAFDAIEQAWSDNRFDIYLDSNNADGYIEIELNGDGPDLLTAIETALRGEEKSQ
jgi:hypothetical protein